MENDPVSVVDVLGLSTLHLQVAFDDSVEDGDEAVREFALMMSRLAMYLLRCPCIDDVSVSAEFSDTIYHRPTEWGYTDATFPFQGPFSKDRIPVLLTIHPVVSYVGDLGYTWPNQGIAVAVEPKSLLDPDVLAHELGHLAGYVGNGVGGFHSTDYHNLMGIPFRNQIKHADVQWCEKVSALAQ